MQDYNYWAHGCSEITVELTCCKYPPASHLPQIWSHNKPALLAFLRRASTGVRGIVRFASGRAAENVTVRIDAREPHFRTNRDGEYYRLLNDGTYKLTLMLNCDPVYETTFTVGGLLVLNVTLPAGVDASGYSLRRSPLFCAQKVLMCSTYNNEQYAGVGNGTGAYESKAGASKAERFPVLLSAVVLMVSFSGLV